MTSLILETTPAAHRGPPKSYSEFTIDDLKAQFGLQLDERRNLFGTVPAVEISALLRETLVENVPMALAISTEKARSELIIAPVLMEARRQVGHQASLFSGVEFSVDPDQGLRGICDFLLSRSIEQLTIEAPVVAVVEAKNESFRTGTSQCIAEMVGARVFNEKRGQAMAAVFGAVTTGNIWKFLRLTGDTVFVDVAEYHIKETGRVVGILKAMLQGTAD